LVPKAANHSATKSLSAAWNDSQGGQNGKHDFYRRPEDLKAKLDRKDPVKVVETLAPERYREATSPER
jgi:hypothetical protein